MIMRVLRKADRESIPFQEDRVLSECCSDNEGIFIFVRAALVHYVGQASARTPSVLALHAFRAIVPLRTIDFPRTLA